MCKIEVSFKKTSRDQRLYKVVNSKEKSEKSEFVKKAIEYYIGFLNKKSTDFIKSVPYAMIFDDEENNG